MSGLIMPYRTLPTDFHLDVRYSFTSSGPDPKAEIICGIQYSLGNDSDWSADEHDLEVHCHLGNIHLLTALFDEAGIAAPDAEVVIALEWTSANSGWRQFGAPLYLTRYQCMSMEVPRVIKLQMERATLRGYGHLTLQLILGHPGSAETNSAWAQVAGSHLGSLTERLEVVIDGDGSIFPVLEEARTAEGPLWELSANWTDAFEEPFSSEYIALLLNRDHELFSALYERKSESGKQTPLMRMVLSSWIALFVCKVKDEIGDELEALVSRPNITDELGSVADAAASFVRLGALDTTSPEKLFASAQCWLDRRIEPEAVQ